VVLVFGGETMTTGQTSIFPNTIQVFSAATDAVAADQMQVVPIDVMNASESLTMPRLDAATTLLPDGSVLCVSGAVGEPRATVPGALLYIRCPLGAVCPP
jgi:hypothetical protein